MKAFLVEVSNEHGRVIGAGELSDLEGAAFAAALTFQQQPRAGRVDVFDPEGNPGFARYRSTLRHARRDGSTFDCRTCHDGVNAMDTCDTCGTRHCPTCDPCGEGDL